MRSMACHSSVLQTVTYELENAVLAIAFHSGAVYEYLGVPIPIYQQLLSADSQGAFFNARIRNQFPFRNSGPTR
jgi:KTSC domain